METSHNSSQYDAEARFVQLVRQTRLVKVWSSLDRVCGLLIRGDRHERVVQIRTIPRPWSYDCGQLNCYKSRLISAVADQEKKKEEKETID